MSIVKFSTFVDTLTSYCVILNNSDIKFNDNLLKEFLMNFVYLI